MTGTYTIWSCCGNFDQEDTKEEAIGMAVAIMNGDHHIVLAVEGPNGEDLMPEAEAADRQRTQEWIERCRTAAIPIGRIEVAGPGGEWMGREAVYNDEEREREMAQLTATYGAARVRWVPTGS